MPLQHPLSNRFDSLPLIICGPIVRRVEPEIVSVWVALKAPRQIELELYTGYCSPQNPEFPGKIVAFKSAKTSCITLGKNLHLALVTIESPGLFTQGGIFSYDLIFHGGNQKENLISLGLLNEPVLLGFRKGQLPSFVVAPLKMEDVRISHGSCRKPHGNGRDGFAALAKVIEPDFINPDRALTPKARPHYFFHTGDQIYADDCSDFLIQYYNDTGNFLLQKVEQLPFPKDPEKSYLNQGTADADFVWIDADYRAFPPTRRATNFYSGFTGSQSNHLWSLAEFAAAYMYQWCDELWPRKDASRLELADLPSSTDVFKDKLNDIPATRSYLLPLNKGADENKADVPKNWDTMNATQRAAYFQKIETSAENDPDDKTPINRYKKSRQKKLATDDPREREKVTDFARDLKAVRRILANTPSIMSFDDHDVTDDWNLNGGWTKQVLGTKLGEVIIRNGLLAFALFQAWGNDPKGWADKTPGKDHRFKLIQKIPELINSFGDLKLSPGNVVANARPPKDKEFTDYLHDLFFVAADTLPIKWHCSLKISQAKVFVLDTRTRRDFSAGMFSPPNLLSKKALEEQIPTAAALGFDTELAIIISGAPVLGLTAIESIGQPIVPRVLDGIAAIKDQEKEVTEKRKVEHSGSQSLDVEHWSLHLAGFEALLKRCAALKKVLFLAGDVHYGISSEMDYWQKGQTHASRFIQMVSSSLKNIKPEGQLMGVLPSGMAQTTLGGGFNKEFTNLTSIGWEEFNDILKVKLLAQTSPGKYAEATRRHYPLRIAAALAKKPILVTLRDWPLRKFDPVTPGGEPVIADMVVFAKDVPEPSFRWKMNVITDQRPDSERFKSLASKPPDLSEDLVAGESESAFEQKLDLILRRASFYSRSHVNRIVNWYSHAAIIDFPMRNNSLFVRHSMFFYPMFESPNEENPGTFENPFYQHEFSLDRKPAGERPDFPLEKTS
jgi:hypothetical protein